MNKMNKMNNMDNNVMEAYKNYVENNYSDNNERQIILDMLVAILELNLVHWIQYFNSSQGFMYSGDPTFDTIMNHPLVCAAGHSGASAGWCARQCQRIFRNV